ncbi:hypothetical protein A6K25_13365 [Alteromonas stellipolaris]|nr:hypothetical protein A6K25_13365 [Alteromonas stellipolaris]
MGCVTSFLILAHVLSPLSGVLEGVSLNYVCLNKKVVKLPSPAFTNIALAFGGFNFATLTSKVAQ